VAWTFNHSELEADRTAAVADVDRRRSVFTLEMLGRTQRWLDEPEAARESFRAAVADLQSQLREREPWSTDLTMIGGLSRLAGDDAESRTYLQRALPVLGEDIAPHLGAQVRYVLKDDEGALTMVERSDSFQQMPPIVKALVHARARRDPALLAAPRKSIVQLIRASRYRPVNDQGAAPLGLYDWLEETFLLEGEPVPDHLTMLERVGLLVR
jgi:hypothetical protein